MIIILLLSRRSSGRMVTGLGIRDCPTASLNVIPRSVRRDVAIASQSSTGRRTYLTTAGRIIAFAILLVQIHQSRSDVYLTALHRVQPW